MDKCCENCKFVKHIKMVVRGIMDADPEEWYCSKDATYEIEDGKCQYKKVDYTNG